MYLGWSNHFICLPAVFWKSTVVGAAIPAHGLRVVFWCVYNQIPRRRAYSPVLDANCRYDVYEDIYSAANWMQLSNEGRGLDDFIKAVQDLSFLASVWDAYMLMAAVNLFLMLSRMLHLMEFHPDIGIVTRFNPNNR